MPPESSGDSLLNSIRAGGPLARLFREAAGETRAALENLLSGRSTTSLAAALVGEAHERVATGIEASPLAVLRQCGAGCSDCCLAVSADVTPLEAIVVADHLRRVLSAERFEVVRRRIASNVARRQALPLEQQGRARIACGLLNEQGRCEAYEVRPLVCAGVFSLSREACESAANVPESAPQQVPLDRPAKAWTMGVSGGLQRALVDAGLDGNLYELNSAVLCALETPRAAERYLQGEDLFSACICTDAHSPPRRAAAQVRVDPPQSGKAILALRKQRQKLLRKR
jgi:Fe-S-cluster containining protein